MTKEVHLDADGHAARFSTFVAPSRLRALKLLIDAEDPPLHPEPFCAAPATLKAMAGKKAALAAAPPPTQAEAAALAAQRAGRLANASRLSYFVIHRNEKRCKKHDADVKSPMSVLEAAAGVRARGAAQRLAGSLGLVRLLRDIRSGGEER